MLGRLENAAKRSLCVASAFQADANRGVSSRQSSSSPRTRQNQSLQHMGGISVAEKSDDQIFIKPILRGLRVIGGLVQARFSAIVTPPIRRTFRISRSLGDEDHLSLPIYLEQSSGCQSSRPQEVEVRSAVALPLQQFELVYESLDGAGTPTLRKPCPHRLKILL